MLQKKKNLSLNMSHNLPLVSEVFVLGKIIEIPDWNQKNMAWMCDESTCTDWRTDWTNHRSNTLSSLQYAVRDTVNNLLFTSMRKDAMKCCQYISHIKSSIQIGRTNKINCKRVPSIWIAKLKCCEQKMVYSHKNSMWPGAWSYTNSFSIRDIQLEPCIFS